MHVPDGFVSGWLNGATYAVSAAACGTAAWRAKKTLGEREVPLLGMTAAFVFAAQMINFPVAGGTSGHFVGATLAAILLGPLNAILVMAVVLVIQCLGFADGGITSLGTNILNMGIIPALVYGIVFGGLGRVVGKNKAGFFGCAALAAWLSVVAGSVACSLELALSGTSALVVALPAMAFYHVLIGGGEGVITCAVLGVVLNARPDLIGALGSCGRFATLLPMRPPRDPRGASALKGSRI